MVKQWKIYEKESVPDCNYGHNIMRIFDILLNFPFTTSETKADY